MHVCFCVFILTLIIFEPIGCLFQVDLMGEESTLTYN